MALILMRHFRPAVDPGVCYGASDLALAEPVAMPAYPVLPPFERLISSPLTRCRLLAQEIGASHGLAPVFDDRLREMDFGAWEMRPWDAIPRMELDAWAADFLHARPHGGESVAMVQARALAALADYRAGPGDALIVTHAGIVKAALGDWHARIDFGAWVRVD